MYEGRWARDVRRRARCHSGADPQGRSVIGAHAAGHNTGASAWPCSARTPAPGPPTPPSTRSSTCWRGSSGPAASTPWAATCVNGEVWPNVAGHRDVVATGCPGAGLYALPARDPPGGRGPAAAGPGRLPHPRPATAASPRTARWATSATCARSASPARRCGASPPRRRARASGWWGPTAASSPSATPRFLGSMGGPPLNRPMFGLAPTAGRRRLLDRRRGRRHLRLRRRAVPRLHRRHAAQPADRRHGRHARRGAATGWWPPTAGSSPSATPRSTAHRRHRRCRGPSSAWRRRRAAAGYWLARPTACVYAYGDAPDLGSVPAATVARTPVRAIRPRRPGRGSGSSTPTAACSPTATPPSSGPACRAGTALDLAPVVRR